MSPPQRRAVLAALAAVLVGSSGCLGASPSATESASTTTEAPATPTTSRETAQTVTATTPTATPSPQKRAEGVLPRDGDGWTRTDVEYRGWSYLGVEGGAVATYESGAGVEYRVVVMVDDGAEMRASSLACAGWPVAAASDGFAFGVGSGTAQDVTLTHEKPPAQDRTPVPDTTEPALSLLERSPAFEAGAVNVVDCE